MQQLFVSDLMRECTSILVAESLPLRSAAEILINQEDALLIACDDAGTVTGIVPESAVIRTLMTNSTNAVVVSSIMSRHVETVRSTAELRSILHLFRSACHSVIPVVDDGNHVTGLLHRSDIVRLLLSDSDSGDISESRSRTAGEAIQQPHFMRHRAPTSQASQRPRPDDRQSN